MGKWIDKRIQEKRDFNDDQVLTETSFKSNQAVMGNQLTI